MIFKFLLPLGSKEPADMALRLQRDGFCPLGGHGDHLGFVLKVTEENGKAAILAAIDEPDFVEAITAKVSDGSLVVIEAEDMSTLSDPSL
jgi:hypothetical protein